MPSRFNSTVKLYKVDEIQKGRYPAFSSLANQTSFFEARKEMTVPNCKIIRDSSYIQLNIPANKIYKLNYLSYVNPDYGNKTMYFIIAGYRYINDQCTALSLVEDPIQTWMFDVSMSISETHIEREMLSQEKKTLADTNPYDSDLWEFDTPEALPVSPELEIREYAISSYSATGDASTIAGSQAARLFKTSGQDDLMTLLYVSNINLENMDIMWENTAGHETLPQPSTEWQNLLDIAAAAPSGFVAYPNGDLDYDQMINDFKLTNAYPTACYIIATNTAAANDIVDFLTRWDAVSTIVNCIKIPKNLIDYCVKPVESADPAHKITINVPELQGIRNKKLLRFPFSYLRLLTPAGDIKELQYEMFESVRDGDGNFKLGIYADVINGLSIAAAPYGYRYELGGSYSGATVDVTEGVKFDQFPTAPLVIDAYLAQMSATASQMVQQHTISNSQSYYEKLQGLRNRNGLAYSLMEYADAGLSAGASGVSAAMGMTKTKTVDGVETTSFNPAGVAGSAAQTGGLIKSLAEGGLNRAQRQYEQQMLEHQIDVLNKANGWLLGNDKGVFSQEYANTRGAYAADNYIPAKGPGFEHYAEYGWINIAFVKTRLREEILDRYDDYFSLYGYTSGRIGRAYVMYFINGNVSSNSLPDWINGETYVKTYDCRIEAPFQYVSQFWENAFNAGIHWLNGDEMING